MLLMSSVVGDFIWSPFFGWSGDVAVCIAVIERFSMFCVLYPSSISPSNLMAVTITSLRRSRIAIYSGGDTDGPGIRGNEKNLNYMWSIVEGLEWLSVPEDFKIGLAECIGV